jgi:hypothetical protein
MTMNTKDPSLILRVRRRKNHLNNKSNGKNHNQNHIKSLRLVGIADTPPSNVLTRNHPEDDNDNKEEHGNNVNDTNENALANTPTIVNKKRGLEEHLMSMTMIDPSSSCTTEHHDSPLQTPALRTKRRPAVWKLVATVEEENNNKKKNGNNPTMNIITAPSSLQRNHPGRYRNHPYPFRTQQPTSGTKKRIVTAILGEEDDDDDEEAFGTRTTTDSRPKDERNVKRCKLSIVHETMTHVSIVSMLQNDGRIIMGHQDDSRMPTKKSFKILHPLERMVDDSLQEVFMGTKTITQHLNFLYENPILLSFRNNNNNNNQDDHHDWIQWSNVECGNILHACAMWNNVNVAQDIVERLYHQNPSALETAFATPDSNGATPHDIAQLTGHTTIGEIFESYSTSIAHDDVTNNKSTQTSTRNENGKNRKNNKRIEEDDLEQYEYDIYLLQRGDEIKDTTNRADDETHKNDQDICPNNENNDDDTDDYITCELQHGQYGYWNENGELVLNTTIAYNDQDDPVTIDNDDGTDENDEDSNDENYIGNDYPDEDDENELYYDQENNSFDDNDDDWNEYHTVDQSYRNRPMMHYDDKEDDASSESGAYDPSYGIFG